MDRDADNGSPAWAPDVDVNQPSAARIYDYLLGGSHNFAADREAAKRFIDAVPDAPAIARANRAFLRRAVEVLLGYGVDQFLDIGAGIPTRGSVHELAHGANPQARVVYVDNDPIAVAHANRLLENDPYAAAVIGDLRQPQAILADPRVTRIIDPRRPVGLLLVSVLHFVPDADRPQDVVARLRDWLAPGSFLVLSHAADEGFDKAAMAEAERIYERTSTGTGGLRTRAEIIRFFGDFELIGPGLVWVDQWRSEPDDGPAPPRRSGFVAGVGRKP